MEYNSLDAKLIFSDDTDGRFGRGKLRVAYAGKNRRNDIISKEAFEASAPSAYNTPVVCHYIRELDMIGGHDMERVEDSDGRKKLINVTEPVGVVPDGAEWWWETEDGKEYFCLPVLLWKRQEAYEKIKSKGHVDHSMEINILDSVRSNGVTTVNLFEFTAFCLLERDVPCYEGAELAMYAEATQEFKSKYSAMLAEFKEDFGKAGRYTLEEGGNPTLAQTLTFQNLMPQLNSLASAQVIEGRYGTWPRYDILDIDVTAQTVYCLDWKDGFPYAFAFEMDGDKVAETLFEDSHPRKRVKYAFVDFVEGDETISIDGGARFSLVEDKAEEKVRSECGQELDIAKKNYAEQISDLTARAEKAEGELKERKLSELFAQFSDLDQTTLDGIRERSADAAIEEIEEQCYAARGRAVKFSLGTPKPNPAPKLPPAGGEEPRETETAPYGGIVERYNK